MQSAERGTWPRYHQWHGYGPGDGILIDISKPGVMWSGSTGLGGGLGWGIPLDSSSDLVQSAWDVVLFYSGSQSAKLITGFTKDANGDNLGGCVVQGFLTADNSYVGRVVSDPSGAFTFTTPYLGNHYLVAYKPGSPDIAGTTKNTLVGV